MGIALVGRAMRRPPCVRDPQRADRRGRVDRRLEPRDLARDFAGLESLAVHDRQAGGVVPPVLESLEPLDEQRRDDLWADVADDSAHS